LRCGNETSAVATVAPRAVHKLERRVAATVDSADELCRAGSIGISCSSSSFSRLRPVCSKTGCEGKRIRFTVAELSSSGAQSQVGRRQSPARTRHCRFPIRSCGGIGASLPRSGPLHPPARPRPTGRDGYAELRNRRV
jgi:hypothetical protein